MAVGKGEGGRYRKYRVNYNGKKMFLKKGEEFETIRTNYGCIQVYV